MPSHESSLGFVEWNREIRETPEAVGSGVMEMRIDYGPGYRVYYMQRGAAVVILLCAGQKGTQTRDIKRAHAMAHEITETR